jgi:acetyl-CoA acetyltransferase
LELGERVAPVLDREDGCLAWAGGQQASRVLVRVSQFKSYGVKLNSGLPTRLPQQGKILVFRKVVAERQGLAPMGIYRGMAVAGNPPEEMGIGPIYAVPKLLKLHGLRIDDIGLWELNEAFACQVVYCRDRLGSQVCE